MARQKDLGLAQNDVPGAGSLPDGWVWVGFTDATSLIPTTRSKVKQRDYLPSGKLPVIDQGQELIGGYTDDIEKRVQCDPPVVIFGDHTKTLKFVDFDFVAGADGVKVIKPLGAFDPKLFFYFLHHLDLPDRGYSRHFQFLRKEHLPLPPLPEQQRIVAEIETQFTRLEAGVAALNRAQANLRRYKASVLKAACEGRLVPTEAEMARQEGRDYEPADVLLERILAERRAKWEAEKPGKKYKEPKPPDTSDLSELPEGWAWARLDQCTTRITDGTHQPPGFVAEGIPFVFVRHIVGGSLTFDDTKFISESTYNRLQARCPVEVGDILYSAVGSYGVAVPVLTERPFSFQRHIAHIKPSASVVQQYLVTCLNSAICRGQAHQVARGVAQKTVTLGDLSGFSIPMAPLAEQRRIVAEVERRLSVVGELEKQVEAALRRAERLRQAILKHAFEGKLVPQDPNDEPASALLARIKAERSRKAGKGKRGKTEQLALL